MRNGVLNEALYGLRYLLAGCYVVAAVYLCAVAIDPGIRQRAPASIQWFGRPGSYQSILLVLAFPAALIALSRLAGRRILANIALFVLPTMAVSALALGVSAYWRCSGSESTFFAPLFWTLDLFAGTVNNPFGPVTPQAGQGSVCASQPMPLALELAKLLAIATTLATALAGALMLTLFRSQLDRIAVWRAHSLTVVVGVDDETVSMIRAIASRKASDETLVVLTGNADRAPVTAARALGAKIKVVGLGHPETLAGLRLWKRLDRLYLMSKDPGQNESLLTFIDAALDSLEDDRVRLPLTVRIDDPWQAEVWRRSCLARDQRWVADAVGRYEITAAKLVRHLTRKAHKRGLVPPETVLLCGLHPLTYALSSELAQVRREEGLYRKPHFALPSHVVIVAQGAKSFLHDHHLRQRRMAPDGSMISLEAHDADPTVDTITDYLEGKDPRRFAVIITDPSLETEGTRLAARFPDLRIYEASTSATELAESSIVGQLYPFPINMELDPDAPQDVWERAAELIHEHYSQERDRSLPEARPWKDLDPFIKQSNRRQVTNALWVVDKKANHTWSTLETPPAPPLPANFADMKPLAQLGEFGFDPEIARQMVITEHEDYCRFHVAAGWKLSKTGRRDYPHKRNEKLKPWSELIAENPKYEEIAHRSLVSTLLNLRTLGYRSIPRAQAPYEAQAISHGH